MQLLIENGFMQDNATGGWVCKRVFAYVDETHVKFRTHNDCRNWDRVAIDNLVEAQALLDELFANTSAEQNALLMYAEGIKRTCMESGFPVRFVQRAGIVEFFYNGQQTFTQDPIFLFSVDRNDNEEFFFSTPCCVVYAEHNPISIELLEVFDVMNTETKYDSHCEEGANLYNKVWLPDSKVAVFANVEHALADCLRYGVGSIAHQIAQVTVENEHYTQLCHTIIKSVKFPEVHAYAFTFLSDNCHDSN